MIRRQAEQTTTIQKEPRGGTGSMAVTKLADGAAELGPHIQGFNRCRLEPGSGLGYHVHEGSTETIYILSGQGRYTDENGAVTILQPGDVTFTANGQGHCLCCEGDQPLEFIALIPLAD